jgi:phosphopantetheinyl transferase
VIPRLAADEVRVIILEHAKAIADDQLLGLLDWSSAERARMAKFRHQGAKTSWCLSRWLLGESLRELCGLENAKGCLVPGEFGKPAIPECPVHFNWSHAEGCVAMALAADREVGIDIESLGRQVGDFLDIAKSQYAVAECDWIGDLPDEEAWKRFLSLFVQKEAWLKARGWGLSKALSEAPVSLDMPPTRSWGNMLSEVGRRDSYYLAVDATLDGNQGACDFCVEYRCLSGYRHA